MPIDPFAPAPLDPASRSSSRLAELERRVATLERGAPAVQVGYALPTSAPRDGTLYGDQENGGLWIRLGGVWRWSQFAGP